MVCLSSVALLSSSHWTKKSHQKIMSQKANKDTSINTSTWSKSHKKKSDAEWKRELEEYALKGLTLGRGKAPQRGDKKWYTAYKAIEACPVTKGKANNSGRMATTFIPTPKCTCKWNHTRPTTNQNIPSANSNNSIEPAPEIRGCRCQP